MHFVFINTMALGKFIGTVPTQLVTKKIYFIRLSTIDYSTILYSNQITMLVMLDAIVGQTCQTMVV